MELEDLGLHISACIFELAELSIQQSSSPFKKSIMLPAH